LIVDEAPADVLSPQARRAWDSSFLSEVSANVARELLKHSWESRFRSGQVFYRGAHHADMAILAIVATGRIRIFVRSADGRQATVRYAEPGAVIGLPAVLAGGGKIDGEAIDDVLLLRLSPGHFRALAQRDGQLAFLVACYLAGQLAEAQDLLSTDLFTDVRTRVARHLLDLASIENGSFVVMASHQAIADAIGSVREVVTRSIRGLDAAGLIKREGRSTILLNPAALHELASGREPSEGSAVSQRDGA
jgi:CRP-like cAMP-binding protein